MDSSKVFPLWCFARRSSHAWSTALTAALSVSSFSASAQTANAPADATARNDDAGLEVVIVTAQRRSEDFQRSSLALDVVSEEQVARAALTDARDLGRVVPSIQVGQSGSFTQTYVRGVGSSSANQFGDPSVTFNQDGVVIDRPNAVGPIFYDIARVEVLKGPQGTLYGRNASGGAVNVIGQAPTHEFGGFFSAQYGNFDSYIASGALNLPATDKLAFRASAQATGRDSYLRGGYPSGRYPDTESKAGRLQMLWEPSPEVTVRMIGEVANEQGPGDNFVLLSPNEPGSSDWLSAANPVANTVISSRAPNQILIRSDDNGFDKDLWNLTGQLDWDMGFATLTVIPAYRDMEIESVSYDGGIRLDYQESSRQKSLETRLANEGERLKWLVGAFYFDNERSVDNFIDSNPLSQRALQVFPDIGSESYALFGDGSLSVTDRLRLIGGVRYTSEDKTVHGTRLDLDANPTNNFLLNNSRTFEETTWRAGVEYDVAEQSMAFSTVSTGFKSGGFFTAVSPGNEFEPEHLTAYTLGMRNRLLDNRLQANFEAFYWKYKNNQQSHVGFDGQGNIAFVTHNAGNARLYGLSVDMIAELTTADSVHFGAEYIDSKYETFTYQVPFFFNSASTGCEVGPVVAGRRTLDCSGFSLPRAPRVTAQLGYERVFSMDAGATLTFNATGRYASEKWLTVDYIDIGRVGDTFIGDIDLTFAPASGAFSVTAFAHNVTDEVEHTGGSQHQQIAQVFYANVGAPRTYGMRVRFDF